MLQPKPSRSVSVLALQNENYKPTKKTKVFYHFRRNLLSLVDNTVVRDANFFETYRELKRGQVNRDSNVLSRKCLWVECSILFSDVRFDVFQSIKEDESGHRCIIGSVPSIVVRDGTLRHL